VVVAVHPQGRNQFAPPLSTMTVADRPEDPARSRSSAYIFGPARPSSAGSAKESPLYLRVYVEDRSPHTSNRGDRINPLARTCGSGRSLQPTDGPAISRRRSIVSGE
jgi:hypothetical protein